MKSWRESGIAQILILGGVWVAVTYFAAGPKSAVTSAGIFGLFIFLSYCLARLASMSTIHQQTKDPLPRIDGRGMSKRLAFEFLMIGLVIAVADWTLHRWLWPEDRRSFLDALFPAMFVPIFV